MARTSLLACGLAAGFSLTASSSFAEEPVRQTFGTWSVTIQPGVRRSSLRKEDFSPIRLVSQQDPAPADAVEAFPPPPAGTTDEPPPAPLAPDESPAVHLPGTTPAAVPAQVSLVRLYSQVYNAIPFSRAEYNANPSYRHDATMEFLFGQLRPTVIQRGTTVIKQRPSAMPYGYPAYSPYGFNSYFYPFYNQGLYWLYDLW